MDAVQLKGAGAHGEDRAHQPPAPPDYIIMKVDELTGGRPFDNIDDVISQEELRGLSEQYKKIAGFSLGQPSPQRG